MPDGSIKQVYVTDVLKQMAAKSSTGKVTIVAHSNGGLLAKALALSLGANASTYIDKIIMVGTPQLGTPMTIGTTLHGDDWNLIGGIITSASDVRAAISTMPAAYGLLPSSVFFDRISDPVANFDTSASLTAKYAASFGVALDNFANTTRFLEDTAGLDAQAGSASDLRTPLVLSTSLVNKAIATHAALDAWTPPAGITLTTIAGWGQSTVKSYAYTTTYESDCSASAVLSIASHMPRLPGSFSTSFPNRAMTSRIWFGSSSRVRQR